jgi:uncharacterized protein (TIGR03118 family)
VRADRSIELKAFLVTSLVAAITACGGGGGGSGGSSSAGGSSTQGFADAPLVVDIQEVVAAKATVDANLKNPWGIATAPGLPFWIADNNSNLSTLYTGTGTVETQAVTGTATVGVAIPASATEGAANPTGIVFNGGGGFTIATGSGQETALFIFDGEAGTIAAWAKDSGATATTVYDDGIVNAANHAVYKGLAIGSVGGASYIYATDLHNNKVDVFDTTFAKPQALQGKFIDPNLPSGFAPFGIAAINGQLYVTFAQQDAAKHDETTGAGLGFVDVFDFSGNFLSRFASAGALNAPWGISLAPSGFASLAGDIVIGNFGDGTINVFTPQGTALAVSVGPLTNNGAALVIPGLWSLFFGNGDADKPATTLFYTAGLANQTDGVLGSITVSNVVTVSPY